MVRGEVRGERERGVYVLGTDSGVVGEDLIAREARGEASENRGGEHTSAAPEARYVRTEEVPATTVDELVAKHGIDPASTLLKIDVQGYEKAVLDGAKETLSKFAGVRTEMSLTALYDGQTLLPEMITYLDGLGFDLWQVERGFTDPVTRRVLQMDGVFFRR